MTMTVSRAVLSLAALGAAAVLAGCGTVGGRGGADAAAIRAVLARSPLSLLHYGSARWWGREPHLTLTVHVTHDRRYARAVITAAPWKGRRARQLVLLARRGTWRIADTGSRAVGLRCSSAPAAVMRDLFGGCAHVDVFDGPLLEGPHAIRPATRGEQTALAAFERRNLFHGHDRCVTYAVSVSRVDERWAEVAYRFHKPYVDCVLGNGVSLVVRRGARWHEVSEASEAFICGLAPPGVVRSLDGACSLPNEVR
jgi:hypothetical protein